MDAQIKVGFADGRVATFPRSFLPDCVITYWLTSAEVVEIAVRTVDGDWIGVTDPSQRIL